MEEDEFRSAYHSLNENRCVFEKSILTLHCQCRHHERFNLAGREGIRCLDDASQKDCKAFLDAARKHARFALRLTEIVGNLLPHGKEIQVQKGALLGLAPELPNLPDTPIHDIYRLIELAKQQAADGLESFPYQELMPSISSHPPRPRHRARRKNRPE